MHSKACTVGGTQQAATDDTIAWPLGGDRLRRWENLRMLSSSFIDVKIGVVYHFRKLCDDYRFSTETGSRLTAVRRGAYIGLWYHADPGDIHCVSSNRSSSLLRVPLDDTSAFDWSVLVDNVDSSQTGYWSTVCTPAIVTSIPCTTRNVGQCPTWWSPCRI